MFCTLCKTDVSHGQTVLRFDSRPFERRFNSDARTLSKLGQAFVSISALTCPCALLKYTRLAAFFFTRCSSGDSISFLCLCVWRRHFPPLLPAHHRGRLGLPRHCTTLQLQTEHVCWAHPPIDRHAEPAKQSTSWAPASSAGGYQLCRTLHTVNFHVCSTFF